MFIIYIALIDEIRQTRLIILIHTFNFISSLSSGNFNGKRACYVLPYDVGPARVFLGEAEKTPWFRPCIAGQVMFNVVIQVIIQVNVLKICIVLINM